MSHVEGCFEVWAYNFCQKCNQFWKVLSGCTELHLFWSHNFRTFSVTNKHSLLIGEEIWARLLDWWTNLPWRGSSAPPQTSRSLSLPSAHCVKNDEEHRCLPFLHFSFLLPSRTSAWGHRWAWLTALTVNVDAFPPWASVLMQGLSYPTETFLSNRITRIGMATSRQS